ncbi:hypothetical protein [Intestinibacter sp.]|uniref:hypothetical protein n=1 Tax=Intestinibacter sp. TaxID=1965304 RepID=UPI003AB463E6
MDKININEIDLEEFKMPIILNTDKEYYLKLKDGLSNYENYIENIDFSEDIIDSVKENIKLIIKSIEYYYNADISEAKNQIMNLLKKYISNKFIVSELNKSYAFRGVYAFEDFPYKEDDMNLERKEATLCFYKARLSNSSFERKDMLHIPFCNRELVSTQRFSVPGVPCLYLGTTSYVCWLEMDKPQDNIFNVSAFELPENLNILNLVIDHHLINRQIQAIVENNEDEKNIKLLQNMIEFMPLVYATSFSIKNKERKFKSEYIISQLIMQCLNELNIDGIAYASKKVKNSVTAFPQCINLAIPMKIDKNFELNMEIDNYADICKEFKLTEPVNFSEFIKIGGNNSHSFNKSFINKCFNYDASIESAIHLSNRDIDYKWTKFAEFDDYIVNLKYDKVSIFKD